MLRMKFTRPATALLFPRGKTDVSRQGCRYENEARWNGLNHPQPRSGSEAHRQAHRLGREKHADRSGEPAEGDQVPRLRPGNHLPHNRHDYEHNQRAERQHHAGGFGGVSE